MLCDTKSNAGTVLWVNSGITFDAISDTTKVMAYDGNSAVILFCRVS